MAATDAFGDASLDADLGSILGLGADRVMPAGRPRSSVDLSRYRAHALLLLVTVPVLAIVLTIIGTLRFIRPESSSDRADTRPTAAVASRPVTPETARKFVAAPVMTDDEPVVATTPDVVQPFVPPRRQKSTSAVAVVRPASPTAEAPAAGTAIAPLANDDISPAAVEPPLPAPQSVANASQAGSPNSVPIVGDAALPSTEQSSEQARLERSRRDNVSAIRSLRRQF